MARESFWSQARLPICATEKHRRQICAWRCAAQTGASFMFGRRGRPRLGLATRERVSFRARLAAPPAGVREVLVKFVEPGNKGAFTETPS